MNVAVANSAAGDYDLYVAGPNSRWIVSGRFQCLAGNVDVGEPVMWTKILAQVCRGCPFCIMRRRYPESTYARLAGRIERHCPFCQAYDSINAATPSSDSGSHPDSGHKDRALHR